LSTQRCSFSAAQQYAFFGTHYAAVRAAIGFTFCAAVNKAVNTTIVSA
jgi:hypothetical protein